MSNRRGPDFKLLELLVESRMKELKVPSLAIGVQQKGEVVYESAYGFADLASQTPATVDTPYSVASITKPMIGTVLAMLAEEGKLDLDAPINDYLGSSSVKSWVGEPNAMTVARVANHTAGLPLYFQFFFAEEKERPSHWQETVRRYGHSTKPAGDRFCYSNIGYGILGFAIENILDLDLVSALQSRVFTPLDMVNSSFGGDFEGPHLYATRYDTELNPLPHYITDHPAASEAYCSVRDLLKFGETHLGTTVSPILSPESIRRMRSPQGSAKVEQGYGLGWGFGKQADGRSLVGHTGGMDGVSTRLMFVPEAETTIVVLCNCDSPLVSEALTKIYELLRIQPAVRTAAEPCKDTPISALGNWSGHIHTYTSDIPLGFSITDSQIEVSVEGRSVEAEVHFEDDDLLGKINAEIASPDANRAKHVLQPNLQLHGDQMIGSISARLEAVARIGHAISYPVTLSKIA